MKKRTHLLPLPPFSPTTSEMIKILILTLVQASTATFEGLLRQRLPLRIVWFNETQCSGYSVGFGGPHYEAGKYSICVYPDAKIPLPEDTKSVETQCTEEQVTTFPFTCHSYNGMFMQNLGPWDAAQDLNVETLSKAEWVEGDPNEWFNFRYPERFGVPLPLPDPPPPLYSSAEKPATIGNGEVVEIVPAPPHMARMRVVRGWKDTRSSSGMPTYAGRGYNHYATVAVLPQEYAIKLVLTVTTYGTGGWKSYMIYQALTDENTHRSSYNTIMGSNAARDEGLFDGDAVVTFRYRTTDKALRFPENVEYLGEGKVLELGDEFEVTPGQREDILVPTLGKVYYAAETFGEPGPRMFGMVTNLATDSEIINDTIMFTDAKLCKDGRIQPGSIPCSDDCEGMKTYYDTYCCAGSDAVNTDVEVTSGEWCMHLEELALANPTCPALGCTFSVSRTELKAAHKAAGCCNNTCGFVNVTGGPATGLTCEQAKDAYCGTNASTTTIDFDDCGETCYGNFALNTTCFWETLPPALYFSSSFGPVSLTYSPSEQTYDAALLGVVPLPSAYAAWNDAAGFGPDVWKYVAGTPTQDILLPEGFGTDAYFVFRPQIGNTMIPGVVRFSKPYTGKLFAQDIVSTLALYETMGEAQSEYAADQVAPTSPGLTATGMKLGGADGGTDAALWAGYYFTDGDLVYFSDPLSPGDQLAGGTGGLRSLNLKTGTLTKITEGATGAMIEDPRNSTRLLYVKLTAGDMQKEGALRSIGKDGSDMREELASFPRPNGFIVDGNRLIFMSSSFLMMGSGAITPEMTPDGANGYSLTIYSYDPMTKELKTLWQSTRQQRCFSIQRIGTTNRLLATYTEYGGSYVEFELNGDTVTPKYETLVSRPRDVAWAVSPWGISKDLMTLNGRQVMICTAKRELFFYDIATRKVTRAKHTPFVGESGITTATFQTGAWVHGGTGYISIYGKVYTLSPTLEEADVYLWGDVAPPPTKLKGYSVRIAGTAAPTHRLNELEAIKPLADWVTDGVLKPAGLPGDFVPDLEAETARIWQLYHDPAFQADAEAYAVIFGGA